PAGVRPRPPMSTEDFYDRLAPFYHLVYPDWEASVQRQAAALDGLIRERWGDGRRTVLDVACGIGTQAPGPGRLGHAVTGAGPAAPGPDLAAPGLPRARQGGPPPRSDHRPLGRRRPPGPCAPRQAVRRGHRLRQRPAAPADRGGPPGGAGADVPLHPSRRGV